MLSKMIQLLAAASAVSAVSVKSKSKCPFGFTSGNRPGSETLVEADAAKYPSDILKCPSDKQKVMTTASFTKVQYEELAKEIIAHQYASSDKTKYAACMLRLEGHDLMDFRRKANKRGRIRRGAPGTGGSDGCVNFEDGDNAGLPTCLAWSNIHTIYEKWCDKISMADFMVLAAEVVVGGIAADYDSSNQFKEGTLLSKFRDQYGYGRTTLEQCPDNHGLMPNPENSCNDLKKVFITHVYRGKWSKKHAWHMTAALSGAHTIGSAKPHNSGYDGMWGDPKNQGIFNNDYYKNLMAHGWGPKRAVGGNPGKNQWDLIDESSDVEKGRQMMLNTDMCLFYQDNRLHAKCMKEEHEGTTRNRKYCKKFEKKGGYVNAKTSTCCAWMQHHALKKRGILQNEDYCGLSDDAFNKILKMKWRDMKKLGIKKGKGGGKKEFMRQKCCVDEPSDSFGDCDSFNWPKGPAMNAILVYGSSNDEFYKAYLNAWKFATDNGFAVKPLS